MSESSKEERKTTNLNKERGRKTSFTLGAAQRLPFLAFIFIAAKFEHNFISSVEIQCNTDVTNFVARFTNKFQYQLINYSTKRIKSRNRITAGVTALFHVYISR